MKVSIALTTYNGSKYIVQQLESIRCQSRRPDEVIICDDGSSDDTVLKIEKYICNYALDCWYCIKNEKKLGWKQNFRKAISLAKGDIIFFSDQDDIWLNSKIEKMCSIMNEKKAGCLYGYSWIIDANGKRLKKREERREYTGQVIQIPLRKSFYAVGGLGCCMCVHRRVVEKYLQLDCSFDDHDSQCPRIAILYDSLYVLDEPVINYRIYESNTSGISKEKSFGSSTINNRINSIEQIIGWLEVVANDEDIVKNTEKQMLVSSALLIEKERLNYLRERGVSFIKLLHYRDYYPDLTMLIGDFAYRHNINDFLGKVRWKFRNIISCV